MINKLSKIDKDTLFTCILIIVFLTLMIAKSSYASSEVTNPFNADGSFTYNGDLYPYVIILDQTYSDSDDDYYTIIYSTHPCYVQNGYINYGRDYTGQDAIHKFYYQSYWSNDGSTYGAPWISTGGSSSLSPIGFSRNLIYSNHDIFIDNELLDYTFYYSDYIPTDYDVSLYQNDAFVFNFVFGDKEVESIDILVYRNDPISVVSGVPVFDNDPPYDPYVLVETITLPPITRYYYDWTNESFELYSRYKFDIIYHYIDGTYETISENDDVSEFGDSVTYVPTPTVDDPDITVEFDDLGNVIVTGIQGYIYDLVLTEFYDSDLYTYVFEQNMQDSLTGTIYTYDDFEDWLNSTYSIPIDELDNRTDTHYVFDCTATNPTYTLVNKNQPQMDYILTVIYDTSVVKKLMWNGRDDVYNITTFDEDGNPVIVQDNQNPNEGINFNDWDDSTDTPEPTIIDGSYLLSADEASQVIDSYNGGIILIGTVLQNVFPSFVWDIILVVLSLLIVVVIVKIAF